MIAISYRREDSLPIAGRLYDRLQSEFGKGNVFMDFDTIPYGVDFREHIKHMIDRSHVLIAVIGPGWFGKGKQETRRIDDPADFVRLEIAYAFERGIPVIPVLIYDTPMPSSMELPSEIEGLAFRNAVMLDVGIDFHHHADRLIVGINRLMIESAKSAAEARRKTETPRRTQIPPTPPVFEKPELLERTKSARGELRVTSKPPTNKSPTPALKAPSARKVFNKPWRTAILGRWTSIKTEANKKRNLVLFAAIAALAFFVGVFALHFGLLKSKDRTDDNSPQKLAEIPAASPISAATPDDRGGRGKSMAHSKFQEAQKAFEQRDFETARKFIDEADTAEPNQAATLNLRGEILMEHKQFDEAEASFKKALKTDPKFCNAQFNLAEIPFLQKDWPGARNRFQQLLSNNVTELQGEAAQLIQYKILLTYLLEGKENMVDSILAKFELSPDTPAVHYANAAIALQRKNGKEAKDWMAAAEKNFSPQLNKLFAESLYEVGWLEKQTGQSRAALELTTPAERAAKSKAFARSRFEQAQQAFEQRDFQTARKFIDEADAAEPNQVATLNLRGEILMEQKEFDLAEATFETAIELDPKFHPTQYNLAEILFKKKDYARARERFEVLLSQTPGGDRNQAVQLIKFKIFMTLLLEGKESRAQKMMEQFQSTGDTPALYYARAAWEFQHKNPSKAEDWVASAKKIYSPALNSVYADSFFDLGWTKAGADPAVELSPNR